MLNESLAQSTQEMDWNGEWIWTNDTAADRNVYAHFRRTFTADRPGSLTLAITADSHYSLYVDGAFICRGPARAALDYYLFDELPLDLDAGEHCIAVLVHHVGEVNACMMLGRPGLLVDARFDGLAEDLSTGEGWRCLPAEAWRKDLPSMMSHFGFWEERNLALEPEGWTAPGFGGAGWHVPIVIGPAGCEPWIRLLPRDIELPNYTTIDPVGITAVGAWTGDLETATPSERVSARKRRVTTTGVVLPASFSLANDGGFLTVDFGRTVSGYVEIELEATAGLQLDLSYDELLTSDLAVNPERTYAHMTDHYRLAEGRTTLRTVHPRGFRYVTLDFTSGEALVSKVRAIEETYPFVLQPSCVVPDEELMSFISKSAETVRICTTDSFTDCPTRERVQWMEDAYMHCRVEAYTFGSTRMLRHTLFQAAQGLLPDGRINGFMPTDRTNLAIPASGICWLHLLVDYWLHNGGDDIRQLLPIARKVLERFSAASDADGAIVDWPSGHYWEWAPLASQGYVTLTNAAYAWALARLGEHAIFRAALGDDLAERADRIRQAVHARCWDAGRRLYRDTALDDSHLPVYGQQANAMAVLAGVCPAEERVPLLRRITNPALLGPVPVGEASLKLNSPPDPEKIVQVGTLWFAHFVVQALYENSLDQEAQDLLRAFWGAYNVLPTFPETRIQHGNTGHCHGWACGPAFLLPAYVLGVQPVDRGWSSVRIQPHPANLPSVSGSFNTPLGQLSVSWREGELQVEAPEGMKIL